MKRIVLGLILLIFSVISLMGNFVVEAQSSSSNYNAVDFVNPVSNLTQSNSYNLHGSTDYYGGVSSSSSYIECTGDYAVLEGCKGASTTTGGSTTGGTTTTTTGGGTTGGGTGGSPEFGHEACSGVQCSVGGGTTGTAGSVTGSSTTTGGSTSGGTTATTTGGGTTGGLSTAGEGGDNSGGNTAGNVVIDNEPGKSIQGTPNRPFINQSKKSGYVIPLNEIEKPLSGFAFNEPRLYELYTLGNEIVPAKETLRSASSDEVFSKDCYFTLFGGNWVYVNCQLQINIIVLGAFSMLGVILLAIKKALLI